MAAVLAAALSACGTHHYHTQPVHVIQSVHVLHVHHVTHKKIVHKKKIKIVHRHR